MTELHSFIQTAAQYIHLFIPFIVIVVLQAVIERSPFVTDHEECIQAEDQGVSDVLRHLGGR